MTWMLDQIAGLAITLLAIAFAIHLVTQLVNRWDAQDTAEEAGAGPREAATDPKTTTHWRNAA